jgi:hypothetical protein
MVCLEAKWASLIPFAKAADLLRDVSTVEESVNPETVRKHLQATAERMEEDVGEEGQFNIRGIGRGREQQPLPGGPITVGLDGGCVRAAHKQGWFEVIAGKSVVAFRREDPDEVRQRSVSGSYKPTTTNHASVCGNC